MLKAEDHIILSLETRTGVYRTPDGAVRFMLRGKEVPAERFCEAADKGASAGDDDRG